MVVFPLGSLLNHPKRGCPEENTATQTDKHTSVCLPKAPKLMPNKPKRRYACLPLCPSGTKMKGLMSTQPVRSQNCLADSSSRLPAKTHRPVPVVKGSPTPGCGKKEFGLTRTMLEHDPPELFFAAFRGTNRKRDPGQVQHTPSAFPLKPTTKEKYTIFILANGILPKEPWPKLGEVVMA